jgi:hypothetical protein
MKRKVLKIIKAPKIKRKLINGAAGMSCWRYVAKRFSNLLFHSIYFLISVSTTVSDGNAQQGAHIAFEKTGLSLQFYSKGFQRCGVINNLL